VSLWLLARSDLIQLQQIAVRVVKEKHVPLALTTKSHWWRHELNPFLGQPLIQGLEILDAETEMGAGHMVDGKALLRTLGGDPLDEVQRPRW